MSRTVYAPIIIPTLNRIEHLKRCVESLKQNPFALHTDLYISVDYPPSEKYQEGYKSVVKYLETGVQGFNSVEVIYQDTNLGPLENEKFLINIIKNKYDRYIFIEDDIEVSPNFIEYMDVELENYFSNDNIFAICACGGYIKGNPGYVYRTSNYSGWGVGHWIHKNNAISEVLTQERIERLVNVRDMIRIVREAGSLFFSFQDMILKRNVSAKYKNDYVNYDQSLKLYGLFYEKYAICCSTNKSRCWGLDGSGVNCKVETSYGGEKSTCDVDNKYEHREDFSIPIGKIPGVTGLENKLRLVFSFLRLMVWRISTGNPCILKKE